jgi:hypothetical protein
LIFSAIVASRWSRIGTIALISIATGAVLGKGKSSIALFAFGVVGFRTICASGWFTAVTCAFLQSASTFAFIKIVGVASARCALCVPVIRTVFTSRRNTFVTDASFNFALIRIRLVVTFIAGFTLFGLISKALYTCRCNSTGAA